MGFLTSLTVATRLMRLLLQCACPCVFLILHFLSPPSETNTLVKEFIRGVEVSKIIKLLPVLWKWMTSYSKRTYVPCLMAEKKMFVFVPLPHGKNFLSGPRYRRSFKWRMCFLRLWSQSGVKQKHMEHKTFFFPLLVELLIEIIAPRDCTQIAAIKRMLLVQFCFVLFFLIKEQMKHQLCKRFAFVN